MAQIYETQLSENLTVRVGQEDSLLERATQSPLQTELILAPVELHRRNIQRRLRESQTPKDRFQFTSPTAVGTQLLDAAGQPTTTIDRIDRLSMIQTILSDDEASVTAPAVPSEPQSVEQMRTEIESVTGFHPERLDMFQNAVGALPAPIDADAGEIVDAATGIERALRQHTAAAVSDTAILRRAVRILLATDGAVWEEAFPAVDCVSLVGVSSVSAAHIDLLHALLTTVDVAVHMYLRRGTGAYLSDRIPQLLDVTNPGAVVFDS